MSVDKPAVSGWQAICGDRLAETLVVTARQSMLSVFGYFNV